MAASGDAAYSCHSMTESTTTSANSYDEVPYPSSAFRSTHPDTLATLATLVGITSSPVQKCRVLELGCSDGGNLLPMAYALPGSEFVGVDLSARQVEAGQAFLKELGLKNATLKQCDLMSVDDSFGAFDFIVAHGIYSWVPPQMQDRLLDICKSRLRSNGVAFVSYNTYPGWHMRGMIREMMLYRIRKESGAEPRIAGARAWLDYLANTVGTPDTAQFTATDTTAYGAALRYERDLLGQYRDSYLYHEHLEAINEPVYFHQFIERAAGHGLQYLSEADFTSAQISNYPPAVAESLRGITNDLIELQQYMDFVSNRTFRQTVLCHQETALNRTPDPTKLSPFYVASPIKPASETVDLHSLKEEAFNSHVGKTLTASAPIVKAAMLILGESWPRSVAFEALLAAARERLNPGAPAVYTAEHLALDTQAVGQVLLYCFAQGMVEFHVCPPLYHTEISGQPAASLVARLQARTEQVVTNMRHEQVTLTDEVSRHLLVYLDGARNHADLFNSLAKMAAEGVIVVESGDGKPLGEGEEMNTKLLEKLNLTLQGLAGAALLVG